ncbi:MAG TPA: hypothetical protein VGV38_07985, partial [Pyrinomonadaceae bacterium]|nr:hypothetical protein [Pyrinomonadaceae bacterium]
GQALDLSAGTLDAQFGSVNVTTRTTTGVLLSAVSGTATFGATSILNPTNAGGYGIRVQNSDADLTFASADISNARQLTPQLDANADGLPDNEGDGDAIFLINHTGSFTLNGGTLSNCGNDCVDARDSSGLTLSGVTIASPGVNMGATAAAGLGGHGIQAVNLTGANSVAGSTFTLPIGTNRDGLRLINSVAAPSTMSVTGTTFQTTGAPLSTSGSGNGILVNGRDSAQMALTVGGPTNAPSTNCTFTGLRGAAITHAAGVNTDSTATVDLTVRHSTFQNAPTNGLNTASARILEGGKANVVFDGNTFDTVAQVLSSNTGVITVNGDGTDAGNQLSVNISNNTLRNIGSAASICGAGASACTGYRGIQVFVDDHTVVSGNVVIEGNQVTNARRTALLLDLARSATGSDVNARVVNNTFGTAANPVGLAGQSGVDIISRCFGTTACGRTDNVLFSGNTVVNSSASTTTGTSVFSRGETATNFQLTATGNTVVNQGTGAEWSSRAGFPLSGVGNTLCLDMSGNTLDAGAGRIFLTEDASPAPGSTLNVEQADATALASANGIPAANVTAAGTPQFGVACAAPPSASLNAAPRASQFYAGRAEDASKAGRRLTGAASGSRLFDLLASNGVAQLLGAKGAADVKSSFAPAFAVAPAGAAVNSGALSASLAAAPNSHAKNARAASAALFSNNVLLNVGTLPAGKTMTIQFRATINSPFPATQ